MVHLGALPRKDLREPQGALQIPPLRYGRDDKGRGVTQVGVVRDGFSKKNRVFRSVYNHALRKRPAEPRMASWSVRPAK